eukprot:PhF_6_TR27168/c0_g2_i5/m.39795/K00888/PI4KA; phosphatidylinositol 4-kinase A
MLPYPDEEMEEEDHHGWCYNPDMRETTLSMLYGFEEVISVLPPPLLSTLLRELFELKRLVYTSHQKHGETENTTLHNFTKSLIRICGTALEERVHVLSQDVIAIAEDCLFEYIGGGQDVVLVDDALALHCEALQNVKGYVKHWPTNASTMHSSSRKGALLDGVMTAVRQSVTLHRMVTATREEASSDVATCLSIIPTLYNYFILLNNKKKTHEIEQLLFQVSKFVTKPISVLSQGLQQGSFIMDSVETVCVAYVRCLLDCSRVTQDHRFLAPLQESVFSPASIIFQMSDDTMASGLRKECLTCLCAVLSDSKLTSLAQVNEYVAELIQRLRHMASVGGSRAYMLSLIQCAEDVVTKYDNPTDKDVLYRNVNVEISDAFVRYGVPGDVQDLCLSALCRLAMSSQDEQQIIRCIDLLHDHYLEIWRTESNTAKLQERTHAIAEIFFVFQQEGAPSTTPTIQEHVLHSVLYLFSRIAWPQTGIAYRNPLDSDGFTRAQNAITPLLAPVAVLLSSFNNNGGTPSVAKPWACEKDFRIMWILCGIHDLLGSDSACNDDLNHIAQRAPKLLTFTDTEIISAFTDIVLLESQYKVLCGGDSKIHEAMQRAVPGLHTQVLKLTISEVMILYGIYALEMRRFRQGSIIGLLQHYTHLDCPELMSRVDFTESLIALRRSIVHNGFMFWKENLPRYELADLISEELDRLAVFSAHAVHSVRLEALHYYTLLFKEFPRIGLQHIGTLLDVETALSSTSQDDLTAVAARYGLSSSILIPVTSTTSAERLRIAEVLCKIRQKWFESLSYSTSVTVLQEELLKWIVANPSKGTEVLESYIALTPYLSEQRHRSILFDVQDVRFVPQITKELLRRGSLLTSVDEDVWALLLMKSRTMDSSPDLLYQITSHLISYLLLMSAKEPSKLQHDSSTLSSLCERSIRAIVRYTEDELMTAVMLSCWRWLVCSVPSAIVPLLNRIAFVWIDTTQKGCGLFTPHYEPVATFVFHEACISFLHDFCVDGESVYVSHPAVVEVLCNIVASSTSERFPMYVSRESLCTYLGFVLLAYLVTQNIPQESCWSGIALRSQVWSTLLRWFASKPAWFTLSSSIQAIHRTSSLFLELLQALEADSGVSGDITRLLHMLMRCELERYCVWQRPREYISAIHPARHHIFLNYCHQGGGGHGTDTANLGTVPTEQASSALCKVCASTALKYNPDVVIWLPTRFRESQMKHEVEHIIQSNVSVFSYRIGAAQYYFTEANLPQIPNDVMTLLRWAPAPPHIALRCLSQPFTSRRPQVVTYALQSLRLHNITSVVLTYLPQLIQCLRHDTVDKQLFTFFQEVALENATTLCHRILWALRTEMIDTATTTFSTTCTKLYDVIRSNLTQPGGQRIVDEFTLFDTLIDISGNLKNVEKGKRKEVLMDMLDHVAMPGQPVVLPTAQQSHQQVLISGINIQNATTLQSAAKCPILVPFHIMDVGVGGTNNNTTDSVAALIFKKGDDCRQDQIAIQILSEFKRICEKEQVECFIRPYTVIPTAPYCGIIECVPDCMSRDQLGKMSEGNLFTYFVHKYGSESTPAFRRARENFVCSMAGYSVCSHLLNVKDRHNGNILLHSDGHVIHIDFGFIFDHSPGGDMNFENSPFKLTSEMLEVMTRCTLDPTTPIIGADMASYEHFMDSVIRSFLAVRGDMEHIIPLVELMLDSGLPCFKPQRTMKDLLDRLASEMGVVEAAGYMMNCINQSQNNFSTNMYDRFQYMAEGIEM